MFKLVFLETASADLGHYADKIYEYTGHRSSVITFLDSMKNACDQIVSFPHSCPVYRPVRPVDFEFRLKAAGNNNIFYIVDEASETVIISRIILAKKEIRP